MILRRFFTITALAIGLSGCNVEHPSDVFTCSSQPECPTDLVCNLATELCVRGELPTDGGSDAPAMVDGSIDAARDALVTDAAGDAPDAGTDAGPPPCTPFALSFGGEASDRITSLVMNEAGDLYVGGWYRNRVTWGDSSLPSANGSDMFVGRVSRDGQVLWSMRAGGSGDDGVLALALRKDGTSEQLIVAGYLAEADTVGDRADAAIFAIDLTAEIPESFPLGEIETMASGGVSSRFTGLSITADDRVFAVGREVATNGDGFLGEFDPLAGSFSLGPEVTNVILNAITTDEEHIFVGGLRRTPSPRGHLAAFSLSDLAPAGTVTSLNLRSQVHALTVSGGRLLVAGESNLDGTVAGTRNDLLVGLFNPGDINGSRILERYGRTGATAAADAVGYGIAADPIGGFWASGMVRQGDPPFFEERGDQNQRPFSARFTDAAVPVGSAIEFASRPASLGSSRAIAVSSSCIYVVGEFRGTLTLPDRSEITSAGIEDGFVVAHLRP